MYKGLVAAAILLLISGLAVTFLPLYLPATPAPRGGNLESLGGSMTQLQATLAQVKQLAEQVNAPLSVVVALMSLYYSRRGYMVQKKRAEER